MKRILSAYFLVVVVTFGIGGCDWLTGGEGGQDETSASPVSAGRTIEPIEGMKYYVGGPVMHQDEYGRMRVKSFSGEIRKPTGRGLVIGHKEIEGNRFELRTWLNGDPVTKQYGFVDEAGLFWYDERSTLNSDGVAIVRQKLTYDDDAKTMHSVVEHLDPADGEVINTYETDLPYAPPDIDEDDDSDDDSDETADE